MFNQKVNGYTAENPDYLSFSYGAPRVKPVDIHNCGKTILTYSKPDKNIPIETWLSKNTAVESFAMRPIVNSKEYFESINKYLSDIIYKDSVELKKKGLSNENYTIFNDNGVEPDSSFLQTINLEVTNKLNYLMGESTNQIDIFREYNPLCEGFVVTDIDITTYKSINNQNHFFHRVLFSAFNTTRYNTVSFKAELYQDTTSMMDEWNNVISDVINSKDLPKQTNSNSIVYVSMIELTNKTACVIGQENDCNFKGYNFSNFSQTINDNYLDNPATLNWVQPNSITDNIYLNGNYDTDGNIKISDYGPDNIEQLIKNLT